MTTRWQDMRQALTGQMIDKGLSGLSRLVAAIPAARPERFGLTVTRDIAYGTHGQRLDVYQPAAASGGSTSGAIPILYLHGGGFRILSKDTHWAMAVAFAGKPHAPRDYVVFVPNYRLAPKHPFPAACEDASEALLWMLAHAHEYGADPSRVVLAGESAGGNLVLGLAIASAWERPEAYARAVFAAAPNIAAVLPACGMLQVSDPWHRGTPDGFVRDRMRAIADQYLPGGAKTDGTTDLADVVTFLERAPAPARPLPPVFAIVGGKDPVLLDTQRLTPAWQRLGGAASHEAYGDGIHTFHAFLWTPLARQAWRDQHAFLERALADDTRASRPGVSEARRA